MKNIKAKIKLSRDMSIPASHVHKNVASVLIAKGVPTEVNINLSGLTKEQIENMVRTKHFTKPLYCSVAIRGKLLKFVVYPNNIDSITF